MIMKDLLCEDLIKYIIDYCPIETLFAFYSNKEYTEYIEQRIDWYSLWKQTARDAAITEYQKAPNKTDYKNIVRLTHTTGCMYCGKKRIRKVWWEFNVRSCPECIYSRTIGEWEFEHKLSKRLYEHLPHNTRQMYNRSGYYTIHFYWKKTIHKLIAQHYVEPPPKPTLDLCLNASRLSAASPQAVGATPVKPQPKQITDDEIKIREQRKIEIDALCISHNIAINKARLYSPTYNQNIKKTAKLQQTRFISTMIPKIRDEVETQEREIATKQEASRQWLEAEEQRKELRNIQLDTTKQYRCIYCVDKTRLFCYLGLESHMCSAIHKLRKQDFVKLFKEIPIAVDGTKTFVQSNNAFQLSTRQ